MRGAAPCRGQQPRQRPRTAAWCRPAHALRRVL